MPVPNAIVATNIRLDPQPEGEPGRPQLGEGGIGVVAGERRLRLDPADAAANANLRILDAASRQRLPLYLEFDPADDRITRIRVPTVGRVVDVRPWPDGDGLEIRLDASHARHRLLPGTAEAETLERDARAALEGRRPILLVLDEREGVIDIREFTPDPDGPLPPFPEPGLPPIPLPRPRPWWDWILWPFRKLWWWFWFPWWWLRCPTASKAQQLFDAMAATTCDPLTIPPPCIPFLYPDDGCWARANEMCRLMQNMGYAPRKVWIDGNLVTPTKNHPSCVVYWGWHVAPTICVRGRPFRTQRMVIDPSLFTSPVTEATWKGAQGDPAATLTGSDASQFWPSGGTDPTYADTNYYLNQYRLALFSRASASGPPPYCP